MTTAKRRGVSGAAAVLAAAARLNEAIRRADRAAAGKLLAREFTLVDAGGQVHPRAAVLANLEGGAARSRSGMTARSYGGVAMVTGAARSPQGIDLFTLDAWVKDAGGWRALVLHDNALASADRPHLHPPPQPRPADAKPPECNNPLEFVPYTPKSRAERDIITSFQTLEKAVTHNDADEWVKHMADEFIVYRTGQHPTAKAERAGHLRAQRQVNAETWVAAVEWMRLWVKGDAAVMRADHVMPGNRRPPYRATRLWVKRDNRWQMAVSQQTTRAG